LLFFFDMAARGVRGEFVGGAAAVPFFSRRLSAEKTGCVRPEARLEPLSTADEATTRVSFAATRGQV
jgi:hypothetical protein